jgi:hypothetical protein
VKEITVSTVNFNKINSSLKCAFGGGNPGVDEAFELFLG